MEKWKDELWVVVSALNICPTCISPLDRHCRGGTHSLRYLCGSLKHREEHESSDLYLSSRQALSQRGAAGAAPDFAFIKKMHEFGSASTTPTRTTKEPSALHNI